VTPLECIILDAYPRFGSWDNMPGNLVYFLLTTSAFFWGVNFVLAGPVLSDLSPLWAAALRFLLGAALMLIIAWKQGADLTSLAKRHWRVHILLSVLGIVGFNLFFFHAMQNTSADNGALVMATNPLLTALLAAILLGERITVRHLVALPVALAGVAVGSSNGNLDRLGHFQVAKGDLLMLCANLTWASFNVATRRYMPKEHAVGNTALMMSAGAMILTVIALSGDTSFAVPGWHAASALVIMAAGGTVIAYLFWSLGIQHLGAGRAAVFLNLVPVFAMLVSGLLGTQPSASQVSGGLIVLAGVTLAMMPRRQRIAA
jgi:drug/metabolite transporter (DMT)-like permease